VLSQDDGTSSSDRHAIVSKSRHVRKTRPTAGHPPLDLCVHRAERVADLASDFEQFWADGSTARGAPRGNPKMVSVPAKKRMKSRAYPDIEVLQEVPEELNPLADTRGEASLRGHLKAEGDEQIGSQSYIPPDPKDDKALHTALDLIRGTQKNSAYPPNPKATVPN
jgi:hypothetical protein